MVARKMWFDNYSVKFCGINENPKRKIEKIIISMEENKQKGMLLGVANSRA